MKMFVAKILIIIHNRCVERNNPDTPKGFVLRETLYHILRILFNVIKQF